MALQCAFVGRVAQEPTPKTTKAGLPYLTFTVAVADGSPRPQYVAVSCWDELGHALHGELHLNDQVFVSGTLTLGAWIGRDGKERQGLNASAAECRRLFNDARR